MSEILDDIKIEIQYTGFGESQIIKNLRFSRNRENMDLILKGYQVSVTYKVEKSKMYKTKE